MFKLSKDTPMRHSGGIRAISSAYGLELFVRAIPFLTARVNQRHERSLPAKPRITSDRPTCALNNTK